MCVAGSICQWERLSGDPSDLDVTYRSQVEFPQYCEEGAWHVSYGAIFDKVGNQYYFQEQDLIDLGFPTQLQVGSAETALPVLYTVDTDLKVKAGATAKQLDDFIRNKGTVWVEEVAYNTKDSPLVGLGQAWVDAGNKYTINSVYLMAHAVQESGWGFSSIAQEKHNIYGYGAYDADPMGGAYAFSSYAECIDKCAGWINANYLTVGGRYYHGSTLKGMNVHYALDQNWAKNIASIMNQFARYTGWIKAKPKSPVELRVYDSQSRVTGLVGGAIENGIPGSGYWDEAVTILGPSDSYSYAVVGTGEGTYGLDIEKVSGEAITSFAASDLPTSAGAVHQYVVDWAALSQGQTGVSLQMDTNGDGVFEQTMTSDGTLELPVVGAITTQVDPIPTNTAINATASFADPGFLDTHTAVWDWGDGTTTPGTVSESEGSGTVSDNHSYTVAGIYTIKLTVTDDDGASGESIFQYVVVYDPSAGFVTGGGWINSPEDAYSLDPSLTGKATFGFVGKYQKGKSEPTGQTQFQFHVAGLDFKSTSYQWLVVSGAKAKYKGWGTINGTGEYGFMLSAVDGQISGGGGVDKFRIKIWDKETSEVIYDNQLGVDDDAVLTTAISGGSIVIHATKSVATAGVSSIPYLGYILAGLLGCFVIAVGILTFFMYGRPLPSRN